jgi:hypothetical protein
MESTPQEQTPQEPQQTEEKKPEMSLVDVEVKNEMMALNVIVSFLAIAQQRGAFKIDEAAKIHECIKMFQKNQ